MASLNLNKRFLPEHALAMCQVYNDYAAEFCSAAPERLRFWAWLPKQSAALAADEARRCMHHLGAIGVAMTTHGVDDHLLLDDFYEPLWAELNALKAPLGLHVSNSARMTTSACATRATQRRRS